MRTPKEWLEIYYNNDGPAYSTEQKEGLLLALFKDIQSDAFHAGTMNGIKEAQEIVRCHANQFNVQVVKAIENMDSKCSPQ